MENCSQLSSLFLQGPCHPWLFIEEAATKEVERDFKSVYSRLVLCKTFRLNEDGKVQGWPERNAPHSLRGSGAYVPTFWLFANWFKPLKSQKSGNVPLNQEGGVFCATLCIG